MTLPASEETVVKQKIATDKQIEIALATARPRGGKNSFADGFVLALIARIKLERDQAVRECEGAARQVLMDYAHLKRGQEGKLSNAIINAETHVTNAILSLSQVSAKK